MAHIPVSNNFKKNAKIALANSDLQGALSNLKGGLISRRKEVRKFTVHYLTPKSQWYSMQNLRHLTTAFLDQKV